MKVMFSVRSHKGCKRRGNEDNLFAGGMILTPEFYNRAFSLDAIADLPMILAVCDGMGGEERGELASGIAVKKLAELQDAIKNAPPKDMRKAVQEYIESANNEIGSFGIRSGTTIALAVITEKGVHCFNVGDTRIYSLRSDSFSQVTNDHTQGAELARSGIIPMDSARRSKNGNKLTRCIGFGNRFAVDSYPVIKGKCRLLICSDGLTDTVPDYEIMRILSAVKDISEASEQLLQLALNNGGKDNITVIAADVPGNSFSELVKNFFDR